MAKRIAAQLATSVVVFCVCAELVALMAYYVETGGLFYTHDKAYQDVLPGAREPAAGQRGAASVLRSDTHTGY